MTFPLSAALFQWLSPTLAAALASAATCLMTIPAAYKIGFSRGRARQQRAVARVSQNALRNMGPSSRRDTLTGLLTREDFLDRLNIAAKASKTYAVLIVDIDSFSGLTANMGFVAGDELLAALGERLSKLNSAAHWARVATDEFAIVLPEIDSLAALEGLALAVILACSAPITTVNSTLSCSVSLGGALLPLHGDTPDAAILAAYSALRRAKIRGTSQWVIYDPAIQTNARERSALKSILKKAIESGNITPHYQPIVDLTNNEIVGFEVLARWEHQSKGLLLPDLFIPMAEEMNLADPLTRVLMQSVERDARLWPSDLYLSLNIAPCQLREMIRFVQEPPNWAEHISPSRLAIEITESALVEDLDLARELIDLLQARGTAVVLDDFGIGYSNFFQLRELPFDRIKIDKSFILDCTHDPRADACLRAMLAVAKSLDIPMVAEGLERPEIAAYVAQLGCRYGQGYLFSRPVPATEVPAILNRFKVAGRGALAA